MNKEEPRFIESPRDPSLNKEEPRFIDSPQNPSLKELVRLRDDGAYRRKRGLLLAEGERLVRELSPESIEGLWVTEGFRERHDGGGDDGRDGDGRGGGVHGAFFGVPLSRVTLLSDRAFRHISDTGSPQGVLALARRPHWDREEAFGEEAPLLLLLEDIRDPGNMGTMFRLGEGAGVRGIFGLGHCTDPYSPKALRASMGSALRVPWFPVEDMEGFFRELRGRGIRSYAAGLRASSDYAGKDYRGGTAFLVGNEAGGLSEEALSLSDEGVLIPMEGKVESMNAAMAAGILLFEAARQRRLKKYGR